MPYLRTAKSEKRTDAACIQLNQRSGRPKKPLPQPPAAGGGDEEAIATAPMSVPSCAVPRRAAFVGV
jgi:hypothetical protein